MANYYEQLRIKNISGSSKILSWVPPNGVTLADEGTTTIPAFWINEDSDRKAMSNAIENGLVQIEYIPVSDYNEFSVHEMAYQVSFDSVTPTTPGGESQAVIFDSDFRAPKDLRIIDASFHITTSGTSDPATWDVSIEVGDSSVLTLDASGTHADGDIVRADNIDKSDTHITTSDDVDVIVSGSESGGPVGRVTINCMPAGLSS